MSREAILARMEAVLTSTGLFGSVLRNDLITDESKATVAMLMDGDEQAVSEGTDRRRPDPLFPRRVEMHPEVYIILGRVREHEAGPYLNWLIDSLNYAFLRDSTLLGLLWEKHIVYDGANTGFSLGRSMAGEVALNYTLIRVERFGIPGPNPLETTA